MPGNRRYFIGASLSTLVVNGSMCVNFTRLNLSQYHGYGITPQSPRGISKQGYWMTVDFFALYPASRVAWIKPVALLVAAIVGGCAAPPSQPEAAQDVAVPGQWSNATPTRLAVEQAPALAQWWQWFNDPTLTALVSQALQANADVRTARAVLLQSRALRDGKVAGLGPNVGLSASAQRSRSGGNDATDSFQTGFDASWEPDVFGGQHSAVNAAEADAQAALSNLAQVQVSLAAEVAVTYIDLRALQARLAIARSNLSAQMETLQITRWRAQAGLASSLDVEQAVAASEQTSAQIPSLLTGLAQDVSSLAVLTGQLQAPLQLSLTADATRVGVTPQAPQSLAIAFPAQTLRQRPDVSASEYRVTAALARLAQADAARYPSFQISGSLGLRSLTLGALTNGASVAQSLLAGISIPLFDGGAARALVRAQEAALEQTRLAYQSTVLKALKDVEDALVGLQGNTERLTRLQTAAGAATNAELLARQRYSSGLIDFRTVLDTQRTLLATQDAVETTRASLSADHVRLYKALGGGWTPEAATTTP
jgi:NodT family efflux transporter outer membrane factor (OMF) lipoprotein